MQIFRFIDHPSDPTSKCTEYVKWEDYRADVQSEIEKRNRLLKEKDEWYAEQHRFAAVRTDEKFTALNQLLKDSIDNGNKIMAELKIAIEKCVELDKQIANLKAIVKEKNEEIRVHKAAVQQRDIDIHSRDEQIAALIVEITKLDVAIMDLTVLIAKQAEEIGRLRKALKMILNTSHGEGIHIEGRIAKEALEEANT